MNRSILDRLLEEPWAAIALMFTAVGCVAMVLLAVIWTARALSSCG